MSKKMTYGDIITALVTEGITVSEFLNLSIYRGRVMESLGEFEVVKTAHFEDYEESGRYDEDTQVTHFIDHDIYIATVIRADSYGEVESYPFGYGREVHPVIKPTTVYE
jgi:hypothetical protein